MARNSLSAWLALLAALVACEHGGVAMGVPDPPGGVPATLQLLGPLPATGVAADTFGLPLTVAVLDVEGNPVPGVVLDWRVVAGGGSLATFEPTTNDSGRARASWRLGPHLDQTHQLEIRAGTLPPLLLAVIPTLGDSVVLVGQGSELPLDTVGAVLQDVVRVLVLSPSGEPLVGQRINLHVTFGGGRLSSTSVWTDTRGYASVAWRLGDSTGVQEVIATLDSGMTGAGLRIPDGDSPYQPALRSPGSRVLAFRAIAVAGTPTRLLVYPDTLVFEALTESTPISGILVDRLGNLAGPAAVHAKSDDGAVVVPRNGHELVSVGNGDATVVAWSGAFADTIAVTVRQRISRIRHDGGSDTLNYLGAVTQRAAVPVDARGIPIVGGVVAWSSVTPATAQITADGLVLAVRPGVPNLLAEYDGLADTVAVLVRQVAAFLSVTIPNALLRLDSVAPLSVMASDSAGAPIPAPTLSFRSSVPGVAIPLGDSALLAAEPGFTTVTVSAGPMAVDLSLQVEGVAILVNGQRLAATAPLMPGDDIVLTNGIVRLRPRHTAVHAGSFDFDIWSDGTWLEATSTDYGDYVYVASSVITSPTGASADVVSDTIASIRLTFDDHWFQPQAHGFPASYVAQPYPFERVVWLREREWGYFSEVRPKAILPPEVVSAEHEIGFGGLWGPGRVTTSTGTIQIDTLSGTIRYNLSAKIDVAVFDRTGDRIVRVLVPLGGAPFITPIFSRLVGNWGSVYVHSYVSSSYGAYMAAVPSGKVLDARAECQLAWTSAPFTLPPYTTTELDACGP